MGGDAIRVMNLVLEGSADSDQEELDTVTLQLRERLLELDIDRAELNRSDGAPDGSKPGDVIALGALAVTMAPFALRSVVRLLETWIGHRPVRTVSITIGEDSLELQAVSSGDQRKLIDAFITRQGPTPAPAGEPASGPPPESGGGTAEGA
ncbi:hypothetical protein [Streptomyces sp. NBC_01236]|uniref:hypothetical protein n=1 Tax=Streptomyces sp. NBC_01236 TaxID=2903789 RepID=UPI002E12E975|nr:hypothetical protein OG324_03315 [Streptomyces sp. NBC_01236]